MAVGFDFKKRLGAGHFGEVWLASERGLGATCAVKLIPPDRIANPSNFFQEAQALKAAEHPNVVRVIDTGFIPDGRVYVSMEFLKKRSLDDEASGSHVHLSRVKRVMIDALRGLEHAHNQGILHRDIKPANILIGDHDEGKLSDFGLALPAGISPMTIGMKGYLYTLHTAPEVLAGSPSTVQSEIYSCGATLFRLVNGDMFVASPPDLSAEILAGTFPDRTHYRAFIPRQVRTVINRALNVDPKKRYQSAADLRHAIEQLSTFVNWQEALLTDGIRWTATAGSKCYEILGTVDAAGIHSVVVRQGASSKSLRCISSLCYEGTDKAAARAHSARVLQDFVLGRQP